MRRLTKIIFALTLGVIGVFIPLVVMAVNITVPSAPGANYILESTSTGSYLATTTAIVDHIIATSTTNVSTFAAGGVSVAGTVNAQTLELNQQNTFQSGGSSVQTNSSLVPNSNNTLNLGNTSGINLFWANSYINNMFSGNLVNGNCLKYTTATGITDFGSSCGTGPLFGKSWEINSVGQLAPTTTISVLAPLNLNASSSLLVGNSVTASYYSATSTTATSTFGYGINVLAGCVAVNGLCVGSGAGTVTNVTGSGNISSSGGTTPNITFTGTLPIANGGTNGTTNTAAARNVGTYIFADNGSGVNNGTTTAPTYAGQMGINLFEVNPPQIFFSNGTAVGGFNKGIAFPTGISEIGSSANMDHAFAANLFVDVNGDTSDYTTNGDSFLGLRNWSDAVANSGAGLCVSLDGGHGTGGIPTLLSDNSSCYGNVPSNRIGNLIPGYNELVANRDLAESRGTTISSPGGASGSGLDGGNYSYLIAGFYNHLLQVPYWGNGSDGRGGVYDPDQTNYKFTVSGMSSTPAGIYTNNGGRFTVTSVNLSGSAPNINGTVNMVGTTSPAASGTLTKSPDTGNSGFAGDATIAFSAEVTQATYKNAWSVDPESGVTTMGSTTLANITGSTQCLHVNSSGVVSGFGTDCLSIPAGGALKYNNQNVFIASTTAFDYFIGKGSGNFTNTSNGDLITLGDNDLPAVTTGSQDYAIGQNALSSLTTGNQNLAFGGYSLNSITSGSDNIGIGVGTGQKATTASSNNVFVGIGSGNGTGDLEADTVVGAAAGVAMNGGTGSNTLIGASTGNGITTGAYNICIGSAACTYRNGIITGSHNIMIGDQAYNIGPTAINNANCIGQSCEIAKSSTLILGGNAYTLNGAAQVQVGIGTTTPDSLFEIAQPSANGQNFFEVASTTSANSAQNIFVIDQNGKTGIGTTSPYSTLAIQASTGDLFDIATSSGNSVRGEDSAGHTFTGGPKPIISSCGTGTGTVVGDDQSGVVTTATAATACTMTFSAAYAQTPSCNVTDNSLVGFADISTISTTAVTFGISSALTGGNLYYQCSYHKQ